MSDRRPIGVFDSGVGGLTVLGELRRQLPGERLLYIADLQHFPYGPRSQAEVREFSHRIIDHLAAQDTKLVVIACNTSTAAAIDSARERFDIPIVGVIHPGAQAAVEATRNGRVAVLSTEGTHRSQQYVHAIREANPGVIVRSMAAPDLVDIVENGEHDSPRARAAVAPLIEECVSWGADTIVLGCTHYPLLIPVIEEVLAGRDVTVVDSATTTAARVARILAVNRLESGDATAPPPRLYVTAGPSRFAQTARRLFGDGASPELLDLWGEREVSGASRAAEPVS